MESPGEMYAGKITEVMKLISKSKCTVLHLINTDNTDQESVCHETSDRRQTRGVYSTMFGNAEESMFHLIWYVLIGLISGVIAKNVMHVHMTLFWTIVLGIIGSIVGGGVSHMFSRPTNQRFHPAGLILSTLGAILVLFICYKLNIHFPAVNPF
jgi:uncharacterized membrane protein YeaQ/YmgE (transglycosylase-associated protein family)